MLEMRRGILGDSSSDSDGDRCFRWGCARADAAVELDNKVLLGAPGVAFIDADLVCAAALVRRAGMAGENGGLSDRGEAATIVDEYVAPLVGTAGGPKLAGGFVRGLRRGGGSGTGMRSCAEGLERGGAVHGVAAAGCEDGAMLGRAIRGNTGSVADGGGEGVVLVDRNVGPRGVHVAELGELVIRFEGESGCDTGRADGCGRGFARAAVDKGSGTRTFDCENWNNQLHVHGTEPSYISIQHASLLAHLGLVVVVDAEAREKNFVLVRGNGSGKLFFSCSRVEAALPNQRPESGIVEIINVA